MFQLIKLQWKESFRSTMWQKSVAINIVLGFIIFYFLSLFLAVGMFMPELFKEFYPEENPVMLFNSFIFMYLLADLGMRFFLQDLPTLSIQPYLHLPISRSKIVHYLLIKSLGSFFNFFPLLILIPVTLRIMQPDYGMSNALIWLGSLFMLMLINNFIATYFKRQMAKDMRVVAIFGICVIGLGLDSYFGFLNISGLSSNLFGFVLANPWTISLFIVLLAAVYFFNFRFLMENTYIEEISTKKVTKADGFTDMAVFDRFGELGKLITLEVKLILRHKRTKTVLFMTPLFLAYGLIFYTQEIYLEGFAWLMFAGLFITGMFLMNYGQYLYAWESEHFDGILAHNIDTKTYIKAKFFLMVPVAAVSFLFSLLYGFITPKAIPINIAMALFNIGVNAFVLMYMSTNNKKRMEMTKGGTLNWQAVSANQFIMMIPLMILPLLIYWPFGYFEIPYVGLAVISLIGLISLMLFNTWIDIIAKRFQKQKYQMAAGFRKQE
ncbi:MAG: DUF5687 family protein [Flammeovirgaceae bacterium]